MENTRLKLSRITIKGFKSISGENPLDILLEDINVLLGANGAGKSNIVSFFKMLNFMMSGSFQNYVETNGTAGVFLHYGSRSTPIEGKLYFKNDSDEDVYSFTISHATPDRLIITSEEIEWKRKGQTKSLNIPLETNFKESALINNQKETVRIVRNMLSRCRVYQFHDTSSESFLRRSSHINTADYFLSEGGNLAAFLWAMKNDNPNYYTRIIGYIKSIMPQFNDFILDANSSGYVMLKWRDNSAKDYILLPQQISDGSLRFIALATLLLQPPQKMPSVIILDEPELGLHPIAIVQLAEMIKQASEYTQIIIATQSPRLADEFDPSNIVVVDRIGSYTTCQKLNIEELEGWLANYTTSELWDKNVIGGLP